MAWVGQVRFNMVQDTDWGCLPSPRKWPIAVYFSKDNATALESYALEAVGFPCRYGQL